MKKYFSPICITIIISCFINCTNDTNKPVQADENLTNSEDSTNIRIVRQLFDHFNDHEWRAYASLYADSARFLDPSFGKSEIVQSREQTIKKYSDLQKVIPDIKDSLLSVNYAGQNIVIVEFISKGTLPDKNKLYLPICTVFIMNNGKIIEDHTYFDN